MQGITWGEPDQGTMEHESALDYQCNSESLELSIKI